MLSTQEELDATLMFLATPTVLVLSVLMGTSCKAINAKLVSSVPTAKPVILHQEIPVFSATMDSTLMLLQFAKVAQLIVFSVIPQLSVLKLAVDTTSPFKIQEHTQEKWPNVNTHVLPGAANEGLCFMCTRAALRSMKV